MFQLIVDRRLLDEDTSNIGLDTLCCSTVELENNDPLQLWLVRQDHVPISCPRPGPRIELHIWCSGLSQLRF